MHTQLTNNPAKFHPDQIWNNRALAFFGRGRPNKKWPSEEAMDQIISRLDLKWQSFGIFWKRSPQQEEEAQEQDEWRYGISTQIQKLILMVVF